jgi:hypothetical protein
MANGSNVHWRHVNAGRRIASHCLQRDPMALQIGGVGMTEEIITYKQAKPDEITLVRRLKRGVYTYVDSELYKRCSRCKEYWPADTEFFFSSAAEPDGLIACCKACYIEWRYPNGRKKPGVKPKATEMAAA